MTATDKAVARATNRAEGVTPENRTKVIIMSQVVAIVALLVLWSILRSRRAKTQVAVT